jgi:hypothetical protein
MAILWVCMPIQCYLILDNSTLTDPTILETINDYKVAEGSPVIDAGLDLEMLFTVLTREIRTILEILYNRDRLLIWVFISFLINS